MSNIVLPQVFSLVLYTHVHLTLTIFNESSRVPQGTLTKFTHEHCVGEEQGLRSLSMLISQTFVCHCAGVPYAQVMAWSLRD